MSLQAYATWTDASDVVELSAKPVRSVPVVARPPKGRMQPSTEWKDSFASLADRLVATLAPPGAAEEHLRLWALQAARVMPPAAANRAPTQLVLFESEPSVLAAKWLDASGRPVIADAGALTLPLLAQFSYALDAWRRLLTRAHFLDVRASLEWLLKDEAAWEGEEAPKMASFKSLLRFLRDVPKSVPPAITIGDNGAFAATWQTGTIRRLSVRFFESGAVGLSAVERDEQGRRIFGASKDLDAASSLLSEIEQMGLRGWLLEA